MAAAGSKSKSKSYGISWADGWRATLTFVVVHTLLSTTALLLMPGPGGPEVWPILGAKYHTLHHTTYKHNYGHYFTFMDAMYDTLISPEEYDEHLEDRDQGSGSSSPSRSKASITPLPAHAVADAAAYVSSPRPAQGAAKAKAVKGQ